MRKCKLFVVTILSMVSILTLSACATKRTASDENNVSETVTERDVLDVMSNTLKEKYLNAKEDELISVTIELKAEYNLDEVEEMAEKNANLTEEEKRLINSNKAPNVEENKIISEAISRVRKEKIKILKEYHGKTISEFIANSGISEDRIGSVGILTCFIREVWMTPEEIKMVALRPEVIYMGADIVIIPPTIQIDTEKYDHMVSASHYNPDNTLSDIAVNKDKIEARGYGNPIIKLDTLEELKEFKQKYTEELSLDKSEGSYPDGWLAFNANTEKYDEKFFEDNTLIAIYWGSASCSLRYGIYDIVSDGDKVCFEIVETRGNYSGDGALGASIITIAVPDDEAAVWNDYDVKEVGRPTYE